MKVKTPKCVEIQHHGGEELLKRLEGLTLEQQLEYWRQRSEALSKKQQAIKQDHS